MLHILFINIIFVIYELNFKIKIKNFNRNPIKNMERMTRQKVQKQLL
jgi:hypothetical protein